MMMGFSPWMTKRAINPSIHLHAISFLAYLSRRKHEFVYFSLHDATFSSLIQKYLFSFLIFFKEMMGRTEMGASGKNADGRELRRKPITVEIT